MKTAVIVGAGISGLLAAKALSTTYERVVLLERDRLPVGPGPRKGTAQALHAHRLLKGGLEAVEALLPGFGERLLAEGACRTDAARDWYALFSRAPLIRHESALDVVCASRALIEHVLREEVLAHPRLECRDGVRVLRAELSVAEAPRVEWEGAGGVRRWMRADMLVDAGGCRSCAELWLLGQGFGRVPRSLTRPLMGYGSVRYRELQLPDGYLGWLCMPRAPDHPYAGVALPVENGEYIVTLAGYLGRHPPVDGPDFVEYARRLRSPVLYHAMRGATPLSGVKSFRQDEAVFRRYDRLRRWPRGFLVIGDAVCAFNPIYGQGMSAAALAAAALREALGEDPEAPERAARIQARIVAVYAAPWYGAAGEDLRFAEAAVGRRGAGLRLRHWYLDRWLAAAARDARMADLYLEVLHMRAPPRALFTPRALMRMLSRSFKTHG